MALNRRRDLQELQVVLLEATNTINQQLYRLTVMLSQSKLGKITTLLTLHSNSTKPLQTVREITVVRESNRGPQLL